MCVRNIFLIFIFCTTVASDEKPLVINLGIRCQATMQMIYNDVRTHAYPFDWLGVQFEPLYDLLSNDFKDFMALEHLELLCNPHYVDDDGLFEVFNAPYVWEKRYKVVILHDFPLNQHFRSEYPRVKKRYERRIARFYAALASGRHVYFIRNEITKAQARRLVDLFAKKFPDLSYTLIALDYTDEIQEDWQIPHVYNAYMPFAQPYRRDGDAAAWCALFKKFGLILPDQQPRSQAEINALYKNLFVLATR